MGPLPELCTCSEGSFGLPLASAMRNVRYSVAMSLDGFIAGPKGEHDWILMDPSIDFRTFFSTIDTVLLGRRTFEVARGQGSGGAMPGMQAIVFSRTLQPADYPKVTIRDDAVLTVTEIKAQEGKDIWLMGGGGLFRSLLAADLVDTVEVAVVPVLLGEGIPLLPGPYATHPLRLVSSSVLPSGLLLLTYRPESPTASTSGRKARTRR